MEYFKLGFVLLVLMYSGVESYSDGAPKEACMPMVPGHGLLPQANNVSVPITSILSEGKIMLVVCECTFKII